MQTLNDEKMSELSGSASGGKKNILKYILLGLILLSGFLSWFSVFNASKVYGANAWYLPIISFSLFIVFMCLATILVKQGIAMEIVVVLTFVLSLVFAFSLWYLPILLLTIFLVLAGLREIRRDLDLNIKVDLWKSLYVGKFKIILALALLISSQYFFITNSSSREKTLPSLDFSSITSKLVRPILVMVNPNFKSMQKEDITVDQFIIQSQQKNDGDVAFNPFFSEETIDQQIPKNLPSEQRNELKNEALRQISDSQSQLLQKNEELVLQQGRKQISQMVGHEVMGNEKIENVFAGLIDKKINDFFQPKIEGDSRSSLYSYVVAAVLFLTIWPLGSFLALLWFSVVILIFKILFYSGLIEIKTITVEREMIV